MSWFERIQKRFADSLPPGNAPADWQSNFTPRAQQALTFARREADRLHHNFVGTEHLLLGLVKLGQGVAVNVLGQRGVSLESVRTEVEKLIGPCPEQKLLGQAPYTPRTKRVLAAAAEEASTLQHTYVGTEHVLLGLLREVDGVAARVLQQLGVDLEQTRRDILRELSPKFAIDELEAFDRLAGDAVTLSSTEACQSREVKAPEALSDWVDIRQRYDVYCAEGSQEPVVYRGALFRGLKRLLPADHDDAGALFIELELAEGRVVWLSRLAVVKFYRHRETADAGSAEAQNS